MSIKERPDILDDPESNGEAPASEPDKAMAECGLSVEDMADLSVFNSALRSFLERKTVE